MGCVSSNNKEKLTQDDLETILAIDPSEWSQNQVIKWLQLTHDGDFKDLIDPFKAQKISGVTFIKLTDDILKDDLNIKQFGLRDGFIVARNKLLQKYTKKDTQTPAVNQQNPDTNTNTVTDTTNPNINPKGQTLPNNSDAITKNNQTILSSGSHNEIIHKQNTHTHPYTHTNTASQLGLIAPNLNPNMPRHTGSFDNGTPDPSNMVFIHGGFGNNGMAPDNNGGYEEIPAAFNSVGYSGFGNNGFGGMPPNAFQEMPIEDDNYATIDYADLNDNGVPSVGLNNAYSVRNTQMNGNVSVSGHGTTQTRPYGLNAYQSNVINHPHALNGTNSVNPNIAIHNHTQTGSNYDELPLEFIDNIPNPSRTNPNINDMNHGNASIGNGNDGGYQEIDFNDDNISSVPSNVPSNADSYHLNNNNRPKIAIGSCVKVFDKNMTKWVEAEVERVDNVTHTVSVKYLSNPNQRVTVSMRDIRQLSPPNSGNKSAKEPVELQQVSPSGDHPPIMSVEEKQIHEFARDLWKTLHKIDVKTIADAHNEPIRGFSGKELVRHVKRHLKKHVNNMSDKDINFRCNDLVKYAYIRLIASAKDNSGGVVEDFNDSEKYLYQFENEKHREFIKDDQPDRRAWTRGTKVEIYSATLGGWNQGTVVEVNNDTLTITYGPPTQQMRKTLDRYQDDLVKSSQSFIENRRGWKKDHEIEVYSHGQHIWCQGRIEEVLSAKENQPVDIFRVFYTNNDDKDFSKYVDRWSPDLREVQQLSAKLAKYKKGTKVKVWSNSKSTWIAGVVIDVVPTYEVVNVRYGDHEKLVPVSSDDIKLLAEED